MGPYKFPNGTVYVGEWYVISYQTRTANLMEGESTTSRIKRILREFRWMGIFKVFCLVILGYGRIIQANGDYYEGELKNGQANGRGVYKEGEIVYEGYFKDNLQHGIGL